MSHVAFRAGGAGEVVDLIDVIEEVDCINDIEIVVAEALVRFEVLDVGIAAGDEVVDGYDIMIISEKPVTEM
jgi:hypothetical protein